MNFIIFVRGYAVSYRRYAVPLYLFIICEKLRDTVSRAWTRRKIRRPCPSPPADAHSRARLRHNLAGQRDERLDAGERRVEANKNDNNKPIRETHKCTADPGYHVRTSKNRTKIINNPRCV